MTVYPYFLLQPMVVYAVLTSKKYSWQCDRSTQTTCTII